MAQDIFSQVPKFFGPYVPDFLGGREQKAAKEATSRVGEGLEYAARNLKRGFDNSVADASAIMANTAKLVDKAMQWGSQLPINEQIQQASGVSPLKFTLEAPIRRSEEYWRPKEPAEPEPYGPLASAYQLAGGLPVRMGMYQIGSTIMHSYPLGASLLAGLQESDKGFAPAVDMAGRAGLAALAGEMAGKAIPYTLGKISRGGKAMLSAKEHKFLTRAGKAEKSISPWTNAHERGVSKEVHKFAKYVGHKEAERYAALAQVHDLGKHKVPQHLLNKPGPLTAEEFNIVKQHSEIGARELERLGLRDMANVARYHHARVDGMGYPPVTGAEIPEPAKFAAIADVYHSLTSKRPYKEAWKPFDALQHMIKDAGHFDDKLLKSFVKMKLETKTFSVKEVNALHSLLREQK